MKRIYLDNAASTPIAPEVISIMHKMMIEDFGNPSSIHSYGRTAKNIVETSVSGLIAGEPAKKVIGLTPPDPNNKIKYGPPYSWTESKSAVKSTIGDFAKTYMVQLCSLTAGKLETLNEYYDQQSKRAYMDNLTFTDQLKDLGFLI